MELADEYAEAWETTKAFLDMTDFYNEVRVL